jgi:hypothetical protein
MSEQEPGVEATDASRGGLSVADVDSIARWVHPVLCKTVERILAARTAELEAERDHWKEAAALAHPQSAVLASMALDAERRAESAEAERDDLRTSLAEAWDEGYMQAQRDDLDGVSDLSPNPYYPKSQSTERKHQ